MARPKPLVEQAVFSIKVPKSLKEAFNRACIATDRTSAQVVREAMRAYITAPTTLSALSAGGIGN